MQQREEEKNKRNNKASTNPVLQDLEDLLTPSMKSESQPKQGEGKKLNNHPSTLLKRLLLSANDVWEGLRNWGNTHLQGIG